MVNKDRAANIAALNDAFRQHPPQPSPRPLPMQYAVIPGE